MEHCRAFSAIDMQLLHDLEAIFLRWIVMGPQTCVNNGGSKEYVLVHPTTSMGGGGKVVTHYEQWIKEVKSDLTTRSQRAGDTVPQVMMNFPAHLLAPKVARGNGGSTNEQQTTHNDARQGWASTGTSSDRAGGE
jgi:hypothetical protein